MFTCYDVRDKGDDHIIPDAQTVTVPSRIYGYIIGWRAMLFAVVLCGYIQSSLLRFVYFELIKVVRLRS